MKFLLFNALVIGSLIYLFSDEPGQLIAPETMSIQTQKIVEKATKTAKATARIVKEKVNKLAEADQPVKPEPVPDTIIDEKAPPLPPAREIAPRTVKPMPVYTAERTSSVTSVPKTPDLSADVAETSNFMTPQQRRRELNKLAHEMELMFADKLSN